MLHYVMLTLLHYIMMLLHYANGITYITMSLHYTYVSI